MAAMTALPIESMNEGLLARASEVEEAKSALAASMAAVEEATSFSSMWLVGWIATTIRP